MKNLVVGLVAGIFIGVIIAHFAITTATPKSDEALSKAIDRLTEIVQLKYPDVNVRATSIKPYGEFYLVTIEFYNKNGTLATQQMFMSANGSLMILNSERCVISLKEERVSVSEDDDPYLGSKDAKVVVVEFSDYTCPYCAKFALEVEKKIIEKYGNKVRFVFRDFPLHGSIAIKAAEAANCAGEQGKYWEYHYMLFERQREWIGNSSKFYDYAKELGLNVTAFKLCLESDKYADEVMKDFEDGKKYGVDGTPTFFVNGRKIVGYISYEAMAKLIERELSS